MSIVNREKTAVTPVVGTIIVIIIILSATATVLLWGLPYIERTKAEAQQQNLYAQMSIFEDTLNSLIHQGPGATEESVFQISMGELNIKKDSSRMVLFYSLYDGYDFVLSGLNEQKNNYFSLQMIEGRCTKIKIYRLGTKTAYSRFNPESYFEELPSYDVKEYVNFTKIHNFTDTINNSAYHALGSSDKDLPPPNDLSDSNYSQVQYNNIEDKDSAGNIWSANSGQWIYLHYKFLITEPTLDIKYINVSWRGCISDSSVISPSCQLYLLAWNMSGNKWDSLSSMKESSTERWLNVTISSNIQNYLYLEGDKYFVSLAVSGGSPDYNSLIFEDYIELNISYVKHDTRPPASYIDESLRSVKTYYDPDSITFTWTGKDADGVTPPEDLRYVISLDPLPYPPPQHWVNVGKSTSITIARSNFSGNSFPRGNYTFRVRAIDLANRTEPYDTDFNTYRFEVAVKPEILDYSSNPITGERVINSLNNFENDLIKIEFLDGDKVFGIAWIFDIYSLNYKVYTASGTFNVIFENGAIIMGERGSDYIKKPPLLTENSNILTISVMQVSGDNVSSISGEGRLKISSRVTEHKLRENNKVSKLYIQIFGETKDAWSNYLKAFYKFDSFNEDTLEYELRDVTLMLIHSIVEVSTNQ